MAEPTSKELLCRHQHGDPDAAAVIFERYLARLLALVRSRLGEKLRSRMDPDDVVQSAYRSFFVRASKGEFELANAGDLWRLLSKITMNKLHRQFERHTAAKRSIGSEERRESTLTGRTGGSNVVDVIAVSEQFSRIVGVLQAEEQFVLLATLQGSDVTEIAKELGKSERTVRRLLAQSRQRFEKELVPEPSVPSKSVVRAGELRLSFQDYVLRRLIGKGGMGKVYIATEKKTSKNAAIKSLHKAMQTDSRSVARLVQEAAVLQRLDHPNIVGTKGVGQYPNGGLFLVMNLVEGENLYDEVVALPIDLTQGVIWLRQIAGALEHAHSFGVVHCDIKPSNILISHEKIAFLSDFGFATIVTETHKNVAIGGTEGYLAPEVKNGVVTTSADIYSFGVLMKFVLKHSVVLEPEEGELRAAMMRIAEKCESESPADRFKTIAECLSLLQNLEVAYRRSTSTQIFLTSLCRFKGKALVDYGSSTAATIEATRSSVETIPMG